MLPPPRASATPIVTAMAMMANTVDSSPELMPERMVVAGPVRDASAISCTGAVSDVVTHVVSDGRRVAGIVLRDAGLDLADQVGAHVRSLGEDAPAHAHEQGEQ